MFFRSRARAAVTAVALCGALGVVSAATAPQASAAVTVPNQTGFELAFSGTTGSVMGDLCTWPVGNALGGCNTSNLGLAVMAGTSPAVTPAIGNNFQYELAYQSTAGILSVAGSLGTGSLGLAMMPGTSPSIATLSDGGYEIAYQSNTGVLSLTEGDGALSAGVAMDPASSPSITSAGLNGFEVAFQDASHDLEVYGGLGTENLGQAMASGTDPSIMNPYTGGYQIAYDAPGGGLVTTGSLGTSAAGQEMPGTSPDISAAPPTANSPDGFYEITFQGSDGLLWGYGSLLAGPVIDPRSPNGIQMAPGASPAGVGIDLPAYLGAGTTPGYEMFYEDPTGALRYVIGSAFSSVYINPASPEGSIAAGTTPAVADFVPGVPFPIHIH